MLKRGPVLAPRCLGLALVMVCSLAGAVEVSGSAVVPGAAGEYVTLGFRLEGSGVYDYAVSVPEGWVPLSNHGRLQLDGPGYVSVTVRVPADVPAGTEATVGIELVNTEDPTETGRGSGAILVAAHVAIELTLVHADRAELGQPHEMLLLVRNRGNLPDVVDLSGDGGMWQVRFAQQSVALEIGQTVEVPVTLVPQGSVTSGYRHVLWITGVSRNDPGVSARAHASTIFVDSGIEEGASRRADPHLTLSVTAGVGATISIDEGGTDFSMSYDVNPRLAGALSDYVRVTAGVGTLGGTLIDPFERIPSQLYLGLVAQEWDAAASVRGGAYSLSGGGLVGMWRLGGGVSYRQGPDSGDFGVTATAVSQLPELDLQFMGRTASTESGRSDALGTRYRTQLSEGLTLSLGADLTGTRSDDDYVVAVGVNESLTYQSQVFDVTQSYSGVPQAGLHNFGLSGGLRSAGPFGLRAATAYTIANSGQRWRNSLTLSTSPLNGLNLSVTGTYLSESAGGSWSVRPSIGYRYRLWGINGTLTGSYSHTAPIWGDSPAVDGFTVGTSLAVGHFSVRAGGRYSLIWAGATGQSGVTLNVGGAVSYDRGGNSQLGLVLDYGSDTLEAIDVLTGALVWSHRWSPDIETELSYEREQSTAHGTGMYEQMEQIRLIAQLNDVLVDGLVLSAGYMVRSDAGLLTGSPLAHDISVRVGYSFGHPFRTPPVLEQAFGGRQGGEVRGVAFIDRNLDGVKNDDEEFLANVTLTLGDVAVTTDAAGAYTLRVPEGQHAWAALSGVPSGFALHADSVMHVAGNETHDVDLPFVPVVNINVVVFDDADHDGVQSPNESGIAYAGVIIEGPEKRTVRVNAMGVTQVTGLLPGSYAVRPDPEQMPARYRATTDPVELVLREGDRQRTVAVGAAAPPRQVVTTFTASNLAIIGRVGVSSVVPGSELTVSALVSGQAEMVMAQIGDHVHELVQGPTGWAGVVPVPESWPEGPTVVTLRAVGAAGEATTQITVQVVEPK